MKYYVIFTYSIYNLGGGQLLTLRKANYLQSKGYKVVVIYKIQRGPFILAKDFSSIETLYIPELVKPYNLVNDKVRKRIFRTLSKYVVGADKKESMVESHDGGLAVWAEYFASLWKIPHFVYMIAEQDLTKSRLFPYENFYYYKLKRNELIGCNSEGLRLCFQCEFDEYKDNFFNVSYDESEIPELSKPIITYSSYEGKKKPFVISTVTRINKSYLLPLLSVIENYCKKNLNSSVEFIIVGDTVFEDVRKEVLYRIERINKTYDNLHVLLTGFCTPGKEFFKYTDLFIGMGTAVISAISQGCISLTIDPFTNRTGGIFGVEMKNFAFSKKEYDVEEKLKEVMAYNQDKRNIISEESVLFFKKNYSLESTWLKQCELQKKMPMDECYYDFSKAYLYKPLDFLYVTISKLYHRIIKG